MSGWERKREEIRDRGISVCHFWGRLIKIQEKKHCRPLFIFFFPTGLPDTSARSPMRICSLTAIVVSHPPAPFPLRPSSYPRPAPFPSPHHAQRPTSSPRMFFSLSSNLTVPYLCCLVQSRSHESAKKATLPIRFVIVGGGPAGLACAVALRRVGHHVIVLEKGPDFIGVRTTPVPFKLAP